MISLVDSCPESPVWVSTRPPTTQTTNLVEFVHVDLLVTWTPRHATPSTLVVLGAPNNDPPSTITYPASCNSTNQISAWRPSAANLGNLTIVLLILRLTRDETSILMLLLLDVILQLLLKVEGTLIQQSLLFVEFRFPQEQLPLSLLH